MELRIQNLSKTYPNGIRALDDVSLTIPTGMYGLLGPNGAGKSTFMRILATLQEADGGTAMLGDIDVLKDKQSVRRTLGYLPQEFGLYPKVKAEVLLDHFAVLKGITNRSERKALVVALLERTNLTKYRRNKVGGFSGGMRQRFGIAVALLGQPSLIIVDEPTAGLDPEERVRFLNLLAELGQDAVVILSTHIVADVAELCGRMAIISSGKIQTETKPREAIDALAGQVWRKVVPEDRLAAVREDHDVISVRRLLGEMAVRVRASAAPAAGFDSVEPDLEDVYFTTLNSAKASATEAVAS